MAIKLSNYRGEESKQSQRQMKIYLNEINYKLEIPKRSIKDNLDAVL